MATSELLLHLGNSQKWQNWYNEGGRTKCYSDELTISIPLDFGEGTVVEQNGEKYIACHETERNRKLIELEITSYRGISAEAIHYYGHLKSHYSSGISWKVDPEQRSSLCVWGEPKFCKSVDIELRRPLKASELQYADNEYDRWYGYELGDMTNSFDEIDDIKKLAEEIFMKFFKPEGWNYMINESY